MKKEITIEVRKEDWDIPVLREGETVSVPTGYKVLVRKWWNYILFWTLRWYPVYREYTVTNFNEETLTATLNFTETNTTK